MAHTILIEAPFASASQTAKILGVSRVRKQQLVKMLGFKKFDSDDKRLTVAADSSSKKRKSARRAKWLVSLNFARTPKKPNVRRQSSKPHASKRTRSSSSEDASR